MVVLVFILHEERMYISHDSSLGFSIVSGGELQFLQMNSKIFNYLFGYRFSSKHFVGRGIIRVRGYQVIVSHQATGLDIVRIIDNRDANSVVCNSHVCYLLVSHCDFPYWSHKCVIHTRNNLFIESFIYSLSCNSLSSIKETENGFVSTGTDKLYLRIFFVNQLYVSPFLLSLDGLTCWYFAISLN